MRFRQRNEDFPEFTPVNLQFSMNTLKDAQPMNNQVIFRPKARFYPFFKDLGLGVVFGDHSVVYICANLAEDYKKSSVKIYFLEGYNLDRMQDAPLIDKLGRPFLQPFRKSEIHLAR